MDTVYQLIAFLLQYPTQKMKEILPELVDDIEQLEDGITKHHLLNFITQSEQMPFDDWIDHYIEHFDFGKTTNLYVTYLKLGEQRERGIELLKLKQFYQSEGFDITDKELPDFLPLMLEFCANVSVDKSNELLQMHQKALTEMREKIDTLQSHYVFLFDALFNHMNKNGLAPINIKQVDKI
ncbi:nitrate reductase molybdenum cofactor assembly chaperone [Virgibacillus sp. LDC-1]|uniref:nitrate reductase molybdenum cofactor assembly chaperone n=1 Tax=Virgibacillus sp. LDC-1 TaxID=3039856 RepID=UPI0024DEC12D|nr:nitrate reductase molybdenum cofactor assembly chaperone [Virgibacillus sp. LDC-1]